MKKLLYAFGIGLLIVGCMSTSKTIKTASKDLPEHAVRIANDSLEYEIIIIDIGFDTYLNSIALPANFYSKEYYEIKNRFYVIEWNERARNPLRYNSNIFENEIDYQFHIDYGLEVNYKLYNYFKFVEYRYKIKLI